MRRTIISFALAVALAGCASNPTAAPETGDEAMPATESANEGFQGEHERLLYELLVGEFAGKRGAFDRAAEAYAKAASLSKDPSVAERAARVALYAERGDLARQAAQRWRALAPEARAPHRVLALVALRAGDAEAAVAGLVKALPAPGDGRKQAFRQIAATLTQEGDPETAMAVAEAMAGRFSDSAAAQYALGQVALHRGYAEEAYDAALSALMLRKGWRAAELLEVQALKRTGRHERARKRLRQMVEDSTGDYELRLEYARELAEDGQVEQALEQFHRLLESQPDDERTLLRAAVLALQAGQHDQARQWLRRLLAIDARTDAAHYYLGRLGAAEGSYDDAITQYSRAGGKYRGDAQLGIAAALGANGRLEQARQRLQTLRADNTDMAVRAYAVEAELLRRKGRLSESLAVLSKALGEYPKNVDLLYARAMARVAANDVDAALADLRAVIEREPDNAAALNALGYTLADEGQNLIRAAELVGRAHKLRPKDPAVIDSMGWVAYRQGRLKAALKYLQRAHRLAPGGEIAAHLGEVLWQLGQRERARKVWRDGLSAGSGQDVLIETMERLDR